MPIRRFSRKPYLDKVEDKRIIEKNRVAYETEMRERRKWVIQNSFNDKPYLNKWSKLKKKRQKLFEELIISSLSVTDAAETASNDLAQGLGIKEATVDMNAVEDLTYNIYIVKLAEMLCSLDGANLSRETADKVISSVIAQVFPPYLPVKAPPTSSRGDNNVLEKIQAIKNSGSH